MKPLLTLLSVLAFVWCILLWSLGKIDDGSFGIFAATFFALLAISCRGST